MSASGAPIILKVSALNWRDYPDLVSEVAEIEAWSISNGRVLELMFGEIWLTVPHKTMRPSSEHRVWLYLDHPNGGDGMELKRATMRFR